MNGYDKGLAKAVSEDECITSSDARESSVGPMLVGGLREPGSTVREL